MTIKKAILTILFSIISFLLFATEFYTANTLLNVRNGEGKEYFVSFTLQKGDEVEVLSKNKDWFRIKFNDKVGYAHSKYLSYSRTVSDTVSDTTDQKMPSFAIAVFICLAILIAGYIIKKVQDRKLLETVTDSKRGVKSERDLVLKLLKYGIPAQTIFHDLYLRKQNGDFSQIDLVVVSEFGIIVFEVKDYSGWLFGSGNQSQWTQVLAYGKQKHRFYNPILQNDKHVAELKKQLSQFGNLPCYSVVVFYGDCKFKEINFIPAGTFLVKSERILHVVKTIFNENKPVYYTNESEVLRILNEAVTNGAIIENQIQHKERIKEMLGKHRIFD